MITNRTAIRRRLAIRGRTHRPPWGARKAGQSVDALVASLRTAATGSGVLAPDLLGDLLRTIARASNELLEPRGLSLSPLTVREQEVLRLVADGHPTREVAKRLSYSELDTASSRLARQCYS